MNQVPISDDRLAEIDAWYATFPSIALTFGDADYLAIRERLRLAEMHAGSDREERQYWESRYVEVRDQLALADAVVEAAGEVLYPAKLAWTDERQKLHDALAAYRAAKETP